MVNPDLQVFCHGCTYWYEHWEMIGDRCEGCYGAEQEDHYDRVRDEFADLESPDDRG